MYVGEKNASASSTLVATSSSQYSWWVAARQAAVQVFDILYFQFQLLVEKKEEEGIEKIDSKNMNS